jgi:hypothetical protein
MARGGRGSAHSGLFVGGDVYSCVSLGAVDGAR